MGMCTCVPRFALALVTVAAVLLSTAGAILLTAAEARADPSIPPLAHPLTHPIDVPEMLERIENGPVAPSALGTGSSVSLRMMLASRPEGRREYGGFVLVELPTAGWLGSAPGTSQRKARDGPTSKAASGRGDDEAADEGPPSEASMSSPPDAEAATRAQGAPDAAEMAARAAALCPLVPAVPPIRPADAREAVRAGRRTVGTGASGRLGDLSSRARWSAALPEVRLRVTRLVDESLSLSPTSYDPNRTTSSGGASLWLEARATWHLDRALFASEEVHIERLRAKLDQRRARHQQQVLDLLFAWQGAAVDLDDPELSPREWRKLWLLEQQLAAELDLATGGWFQRWLRRTERARAAELCDGAEPK